MFVLRWLASLEEELPKRLQCSTKKLQTELNILDDYFFFAVSSFVSNTGDELGAVSATLTGF